MKFRFFKLNLLYGLLPFLFSCSWNPPPHLKNSLSYLNGKHYQRGPITFNNMNIPTGFRRVTYLKGQLTLTIKNQQRKLPFTKIQFIHQQTHERHEMSSDEKGHFFYEGEMTHGIYQVIIEINNHTLSKEILIDQYDNPQLNLSFSLP